MIKLKNLMKEFIEDESGLTAVEYAVAGGLVVAGMAGAFATLGTNAEGEISSLCTELGTGVSNGNQGTC